MKGTYYIGFGVYKRDPLGLYDRIYQRLFWYSEIPFKLKYEYVGNECYRHQPTNGNKNILHEDSIKELKRRNLIAPPGTVLRITLEGN